MKISKEFILREIAGEYILVPVGKTALTFNGLVTVNEVGALIWGMLEKAAMSVRSSTAFWMNMMWMNRLRRRMCSNLSAI